jgi:hypothetical protein
MSLQKFPSLKGYGSCPKSSSRDSRSGSYAYGDIPALPARCIPLRFPLLVPELALTQAHLLSLNASMVASVLQRNVPKIVG